MKWGQLHDNKGYSTMILYVIFKSAYWQPSLIERLFTRRSVSVEVLPCSRVSVPSTDARFTHRTNTPSCSRTSKTGVGLRRWNIKKLRISFYFQVLDCNVTIECMLRVGLQSCSQTRWWSVQWPTESNFICFVYQPFNDRVAILGHCACLKCMQHGSYGS